MWYHKCSSKNLCHDVQRKAQTMSHLESVCSCSDESWRLVLKSSIFAFNTASVIPGPPDGLSGLRTARKVARRRTVQSTKCDTRSSVQQPLFASVVADFVVNAGTT